MHILVYTFYNPRALTFKVVRSLEIPGVDKYFIGSLATLTKLISTNHYDFVLGLGDYRKTAKRVRVEEKFINKYGRQVIVSPGQEFYPATWEIPFIGDMYRSDKASNGPCNRSGYLVSKEIADKGLTTKYAFIHIPSSLNIETAQELIRLIYEKENLAEKAK